MSRAEDLVGNVLHITPQSGDTINPLISGPIVTIIPEKIKLSYTLLDQARVSLSAIQPQYADPFSETERAAYAMAIARVYHGATSRAGSPGPTFEDVLGELRRVAPQQFLRFKVPRGRIGLWELFCFHQIFSHNCI